jgi:hypothetical protein
MESGSNPIRIHNPAFEHSELGRIRIWSKQDPAKISGSRSGKQSGPLRIRIPNFAGPYYFYAGSVTGFWCPSASAPIAKQA